MAFDPISFAKVSSLEKGVASNENLLLNVLANIEYTNVLNIIMGSAFNDVAPSGIAEGSTATYASLEAGFMPSKKIVEIQESDQIYEQHIDGDNIFILLRSGLKKYSRTGNLITTVPPENQFGYSPNNRSNFTWDENNLYLLDSDQSTTWKVKAYRKSDMTLLWSSSAYSGRALFITTHANSDGVFVYTSNVNPKGFNKTDGENNWTAGTYHSPYTEMFNDWVLTYDGKLWITDRYGYESGGAGSYGVRARYFDTSLSNSSLTNTVSYSGKLSTGHFYIDVDTANLYFMPNNRYIFIFDLLTDTTSYSASISHGSINSEFNLNVYVCEGVSIDSQNKNVTSVWRDESDGNMYVISHEIDQTDGVLLNAIKPAIKIPRSTNAPDYTDEYFVVSKGIFKRAAQDDTISLVQNKGNGEYTLDVRKKAEPPTEAWVKYSKVVTTSPPADLKIWKSAKIDSTIPTNNDLWLTMNGQPKNTDENGEPNFENIISTQHNLIISDRKYNETLNAATSKIRIKNALQTNILWVNKVELNGRVTLSKEWSLSGEDNRTITFLDILNIGDNVTVYYDLDYTNDSLPFYVNMKRIDPLDEGATINQIVLTYEV